jgi:hypothetical protein
MQLATAARPLHSATSHHAHHAPKPHPAQAFHALHEQSAASAPLWDSAEGTITGIISASDFIHILTRLKHDITSGANPLSEVRCAALPAGGAACWRR